MKKIMSFLFRNFVFLLVVIFTFMTFIKCNNSNNPNENNQGTTTTTGSEQTDIKNAKIEGIIFPKEDQCVQKGYVHIRWNPKEKRFFINLSG